MTDFRIKRLTPTAMMPRRTSRLAAGVDVMADLFDAAGNPREIRTNQGTGTLVAAPFTGHRDAAAAMAEHGWVDWGFDLAPGQRVLIPSGLSMRTSPDVYVRVAPRSGLAVKNGLDVLAGVVDADYPGEVGVVLVNTDPSAAIRITHGMRVAQLVLEMISLQDPVEVDDFEQESDRNAAGFGSSGLR